MIEVHISVAVFQCASFRSSNGYAMVHVEGEWKEHRSPGQACAGEFIEEHQQQHRFLLPARGSSILSEAIPNMSMSFEISPLNPGQDSAKASDTMDWALEQEAEEAESDRTVWESGLSARGWDPSADWLLAGN